MSKPLTYCYKENNFKDKILSIYITFNFYKYIIYIELVLSQKKKNKVDLRMFEYVLGVCELCMREMEEREVGKKRQSKRGILILFHGLI